MMTLKSKLLTALVLTGTCALAHAVPATYTMTVDGVSATVNGVNSGAGTTTVIVVNADTTAVAAAGGTRVCVKGTSGTISNTGINGGAAQALTGNYYVCASTTGDNVGIYPDTTGSSPAHGGNGGPGTGALTGAPLVNLVTNLAPVSYLANTIHSHGPFGGTLDLLAGGVYSANLPEAVGNTTASTFGVSGVVAAVAASIPTLSQWGIIFLASIMAMVGIAMTRRRRD